MAHRVFPAVLDKWINDIRTYDLQDVHETLDGTVQTIKRAPGGWEGTLVLAACGIGDEARLRTTRAFIASLDGRANTFDAPVGSSERGSIAGGPKLTLRTVPTLSGGLTVIAVSGARAGLLRGDMVSIGGRAYILQSDMAGGTFNAWPPRITGAAGDVVEWENPVIRARLTDPVRNANVGAGIFGPWSIRWRYA